MNGQQTFTVEKVGLLDTLRRNRRTHQEDFDAAEKGFRKAAIVRMQDHLSLAREGGKIKTRLGLEPPQSHLEDYDNIIGLLTMSTEDEIEIDEHDYRQYVKDEWGWSQSFTVSSALYNNR